MHKEKICNWCKKKGHIAKDCRSKLAGKPRAPDTRPANAVDQEERDYVDEHTRPLGSIGRSVDVLTVSDFMLNPNEFKDLYVDESEDEDDEDEENDEGPGQAEEEEAGARERPKEKSEYDGFRVVGAGTDRRSQFVTFRGGVKSRLGK